MPRRANVVRLRHKDCPRGLPSFTELGTRLRLEIERCQKAEFRVMCSRHWGISPGVAVAWMLVAGCVVFGGPAHWLAGNPCFAEPPPRQIALRLSGDLFAPRIEQPIEQRVPVDELILGVRALGEAHVAGQPKLVLADDADEAAFCVTISGVVESRTIGCKGPVRIHSLSKTRFVATKRVAYHPGRGFISDSAQIEAQSSSQVDRIVPFCQGSLGKMIERQAWARVAQSQEQVNRIVKAKAEARIREAFDGLLDERLARLNRLVDQRYLLAALLGGSEMPAFRCCTRDGALVIVATTGAAPDPGVATSDIIDRGRKGPLAQVWVHENVVGDWPAALVRGVELTRRLVSRPPTTGTAPQDASSKEPFGAYDFATAGDWIVVHTGKWNRTAGVVAGSDSEDAPSRLAVGGGP